MPGKNFEEQLKNEVARLRDLAMRSIDPLIVGKSVAASDRGVHELILKRLAGGERLMEVIAFNDNSPTQVQVFFRFAPSEKEIVHMVDKGILVTVDMTKSEVAGTIDPYDFQPEQRIGRPFVSVTPPDTFQFAARDEGRRVMQARERAFFKKVKISVGRFGAGSVIPTIIGTETVSGDRDETDDTISDAIDDPVEESVI
jgi:hypothetical protein